MVKHIFLMCFFTNNLNGDAHSIIKNIIVLTENPSSQKNRIIRPYGLIKLLTLCKNSVEAYNIQTYLMKQYLLIPASSSSTILSTYSVLLIFDKNLEIIPKILKKILQTHLGTIKNN